MKRARYVLTTVIITAALFVLSAAVQGLSVKEVLTDLPARLYVPHYNTFKVEDIGRFNALLVFYAGWAVSVLVVLAVNRFRGHKLAIYQSAWTAGVSTMVLFSVFHLFGWQRHAAAEWARFSGRSIEERCEEVFGDTYCFARRIREHLPAGSALELRTDLEDTAQGVPLVVRTLMYYALPVDLTVSSVREPDGRVFFHAQDAAERLPDDYRLLYRADDHSAIAVRRESHIRAGSSDGSTLRED